MIAYFYLCLLKYIQNYFVNFYYPAYSLDFFRNLLRGRDLSRYGTRNPHLLPCKLRLLRSGSTQLTPAHDGSERSLFNKGNGCCKVVYSYRDYLIDKLPTMPDS